MARSMKGFISPEQDDQSGPNQQGYGQSCSKNSSGDVTESILTESVKSEESAQEEDSQPEEHEIDLQETEGFEDLLLTAGRGQPRKNIVRKPFILYPDQTLRMCWDVFISIVLMISCFTTPFDLAFP